MGRPAKNGVYDFRIRAQKCNKSCKDYGTCTIRLDPCGTCKKRDRKEYYVKYVHIVQPDGTTKRKEVYGKTPEDLTRKVAAYVETKGTSDVTLGDWVELWKKGYLVETRMKASSCTFYRSLMKKIPKSLLSMKIEDIRPIHLETLFSQLLTNGGVKEKGLSTKTVRSFRTMLISCLDRAVENKVVSQNVAKKVKPPKLQQKEISFLSVDDIQALLRVAESGSYYAGLEQAMQDEGSRYLIRQWAMVIRLALATGMRRGEVFGLTWAKIDFDNNTVTVDKNLQAGKLESPKTSYSVRTISIDTDTMKRLKEWREYQERYATSLGDLFSNTLDLLFTNSFGKHVNYDNFRIRYFDKMVVKAMLPTTITFHSLRHTHATQLLAAGVDAKTVSARLGHSSVAFTLQTYTHVLQTVERAAADAIGAILTGNGKKNE